MPEPEIKQLPSIWGYVNWTELRSVVIWSNVFQAALDTVILPILASHSVWLAEPWSSRLAPIFALAIALLSGRALGKKLIEQGN